MIHIMDARRAVLLACMASALHRHLVEAGRLSALTSVFRPPHLVLPDSFEDELALSEWREAREEWWVPLPGEWRSMETVDEVFTFDEMNVTLSNSKRELLLRRSNHNGDLLQAWRLKPMVVVVDKSAAASNACFEATLIENVQDDLPMFAKDSKIWCRYNSANLGWFHDCMDFGPTGILLRSLCKEDESDSDSEWDDFEDAAPML